MKKILLLVFTLVAVFQWQDVNATTCAGVATGVTGSNTLVGTGTNDISGLGNYTGGWESLLTYTPTMTGDMTLAYTNGVSWSGIFVYDECPTSGTQTELGFTGSSATSETLVVSVTSGTTYWIMVDTWPTPNDASNGGAALLDISVAAPALPPANDEPNAASPVTINTDGTCTATTAGTIDAATASAEDAATCGGTENDDVWFSFVAPATTVDISLLNVAGSTTDLYHSLWEGTFGSLTSVPSTCADPNTSSPAGLTIGNTYYLRVNSWGTTSQTTTFDVCIQALLCTGPTYTTTVVDDCANNQFTIDIALTDLGSAAAYGVEVGGSLIGGIGAIGTTNVGPFPNGTSIDATLIHNVDVACNAAVPTLTNGICPTIITCGSTVNTTDCYVTGTISEWYFASSTGDAVSITVNAGQVENTFDEFEVYDGANASATQLYSGYGTAGDLAGLTFNSSGSEMYIRITPDVSADCVSSSYTSLDFDMVCLACSGPTATFTVVPDCGNDQYYVDVDVTDMGSATSYDLQDGAAASLATITLTGTYTIGPYASGVSNDFTLIHNLDVACNFSETGVTYSCPPANDDAGGAIPLSLGTGACATATLGTNAAATNSGLSHSCADYQGGDIWYSVVVPAGGAFIVESYDIGSPFSDGGMSAYDASFTELACNDDGGTSAFEQLSFSGYTPGDIIYIAVWEYGNNAVGDFEICAWTPAAAPANDDCGSPTPLTVNADLACGSFSSGTLDQATASGEAEGCSGTFDNDVWYSFTATATEHEIQVSNIAGSSTDMIYQLTDGCGGTELECGDTPNSGFTASGLTIGNSYLIRVDTWNGTAANTTFDICVGTPPPPPPAPANDLCADAIAVSCGNTYLGTNTAATTTGEPGAFCGTGSGSGGVWYLFSGTGNDATFSLDNAATDFDTKIHVYSGSCGALTCVDGDDDDGAGTTSIVTVPTTMGTDYYVYVYGFNTNQGNFGLEVSCTNTWTGATDSDWHTASNWSAVSVPSATAVVVIPDVTNQPVTTTDVMVGDLTIEAGATLDIGSNAGLIIATGGTVNNNGGSVVFKSTASGTAYLDDFTNGGTFNGDITMERFVPFGGSGLGQRFFGSPVTGGTISGLDATYVGYNGGVGQVVVDVCGPVPALTMASPYSNMFSWNPLSLFPTGCDLEGWNAMDASTVMTVGQGYSGWMVDGSVISTTGTPNSGVITYNTASTAVPNPAAPANVAGWDLISNPYPSPVDVSALFAFGDVVMFDASSGPFSGSFYAANFAPVIASMQGVYVNNSLGLPVVGIDNSVRVASSATTFYETEDLFSQMLEVQVHGNGFADRTYVYYAEDANVTSAYDVISDCKKKSSNPGQPTIYTSNSDLKLALNGLATSDMGQSVPMGVDHGTDGDFELVFEGLTTLPANTTVYVEDLQTGVYHNTANGNYAYSALASDNGDRFVIHFVLPVALATTNVDCQGNLGNITLESTEGSAERNFVLAQGATTISTDDLANLNAQVTAGEYVLTVSDAFGGNQVYDVAITEADAIVAAMEVSSLNVQVGELVNFNNLTADVTNLEWTINGSVINGVNNATYTFDEAGTYPVLLNVSNEECADAKSVTIEVTNKTTSIINVDGNQSIKVYSVGTELVLEFVNSNSSNAVLNVNNVIGQSVYNGTVSTEGTQRVNIADVKTGYYFVSLNIAGTNVSTKVLLTNR